jgi:hypothetical protein
MALENLISISFTEEELQQIDSHLTALEGLLKGKCVTLTTEQRKEYGRLGDKTENWVKKVVDYTTAQPELNPKSINKAELDKDYKARTDLMPRLNKLTVAWDLLDDTLLLLGFDLYQSARKYYSYIRYETDNNTDGAKSIYDDLSAQFPGRPAKKSEAK